MLENVGERRAVIRRCVPGRRVCWECGWVWVRVWGCVGGWGVRGRKNKNKQIYAQDNLKLNVIKKTGLDCASAIEKTNQDCASVFYGSGEEAWRVRG